MNAAAAAIQKLLNEHFGPILTEDEHAAGYGASSIGFKDGLNAALRAVQVLPEQPHKGRELAGILQNLVDDARLNAEYPTSIQSVPVSVNFIEKLQKYLCASATDDLRTLREICLGK